MGRADTERTPGNKGSGCLLRNMTWGLQQQNPFEIAVYRKGVNSITLSDIDIERSKEKILGVPIMRK